MTPVQPHIVPALRFHRLTPAYDFVVAATTRERIIKMSLLDQAHIEPRHCVLDLASGTGTLSIWAKLRQPQACVFGIDADPAILAIARSKSHREGVDVKFAQGRSTFLPYADASFDRVLSSLFFHHLSWEDKQATAAEVYRVLRPGGELHVADWGLAKGSLARTAFLTIQLLDGFVNTQDNVNGRLESLFQSAGFTKVSELCRFATIFGILSLYRAAKSVTDKQQLPQRQRINGGSHLPRAIGQVHEQN